MLPKTPENHFQERKGVNAFAVAAANKKLIWRETLMADVGIDGHLEYVDAECRATGRMVGVQIKSGPSFFGHSCEQGWLFYPEGKHRAYWEAYPVPVILVLHDPQAEKSYWIDARQSLRSPVHLSSRGITVPRANVLEDTVAERLFETAGVTTDAFLPGLADVLRAMTRTVHADTGFPVSYFELFTHGLTNMCRALYYGVDLAIEAAQWNLRLSDSGPAVRMDRGAHDFLFEYVRFILSQNLASIDYSDCLIDWTENEIQPQFVAPLTARGRALVGAIGKIQAQLVARDELPDCPGLRVAQEGYFMMDGPSYTARLPLISRFQAILRDGRDLGV